MDRDEIRAGIASGELVRGTVERSAQGEGDRPVMGDYLAADAHVRPQVRPGKTVVAFEIVGPAFLVRAGSGRWRAPVVAVARRG